MRNMDDPKISTEAADWLFRLEEDSTLESSAEFVAWLKRSPRHMGEFLMATATFNSLRSADAADLADVVKEIEDATESTGNIVPLTEPTPVLAKETLQSIGITRVKRSSRVLRWSGIAASALACGILFQHLSPLRGADPGVYATRFGEQRSFKLEDGSVLYLNTESRVQVKYSTHGRDVELRSGEALFVVAQDKIRPFRVHAGASVVQAVGTQFNVYRGSSVTTVSVIEGRVNVATQDRQTAAFQPSATGKPSALTSTSLGAGEEARIDANGEWVKRDKVNAAHATAWRQRRLVFEATPLADVIREFNRYNRTSIQVEGSQASTSQITGVFNADEPEALLTFLRADPDLDIRTAGKEIVIRTRSH